MDPHQRLTCEQLLLHPWIAGTDASQNPIPNTAKESLRDFNKARRQFRKGLVGIVASQRYIRMANRVTLFPSEMDELQHVFLKFANSEDASCGGSSKLGDGDEDGLGTMPVTRLSEAMRSLGEKIRDREAIALALQSGTVDMQGRLSFSSFVAVVARYVEGRETEEDLQAAFKFLDKQNRGTISYNDIQRALALMGVRMSERDVEELIQGSGASSTATGAKTYANGGGGITFPQFVQLFREQCGK